MMIRCHTRSSRQHYGYRNAPRWCRWVTGRHCARSGHTGKVALESVVWDMGARLGPVGYAGERSASWVESCLLESREPGCVAPAPCAPSTASFCCSSTGRRAWWAGTGNGARESIKGCKYTLYAIPQSVRSGTCAGDQKCPPVARRAHFARSCIWIKCVWTKTVWLFLALYYS